MPTDVGDDNPTKIAGGRWTKDVIEDVGENFRGNDAGARSCVAARFEVAFNLLDGQQLLVYQMNATAIAFGFGEG